jgi:hypothetical protein
MTDLDEIGRRVYEEVFGRAPRSTWFRVPRGAKTEVHFSWTTEPLDGLYGSFVHVPKGKGSRSRDARLWLLDERLTAVHSTRREARARALRLYRAYYEHGCSLASLADGSYLDALREAG